MELQLGLALPINHIYNPIKHGIGIESKKLMDCLESKNCTKRKRSFEEDQHKPIEVTENENEPSQTLPLLSWNDQPRDGDHNREEPKKRNFCDITEEDEEKNQVVGWPPIKLWRKKELHQQQEGAPATENRRRRVKLAENNGNGGVKNSLFVKVKMEGVGITRKLDLRLYHSHHSLRTALINMFTAYKTWEKDSWDLTLIYEDKEGDWLLAEDLPWKSFVETVQSLKILVRKRNND